MRAIFKAWSLGSRDAACSHSTLLLWGPDFTGISSPITDEVSQSILRLNDSELEKCITGKVMASGSGSDLLGSELDF